MRVCHPTPPAGAVPVGRRRRVTDARSLVHAYRNGRCAVFAEALRREFGWPIRGLFAQPDYRDPLEECFVHAYGVRPDGGLVDAGGEFEMDWLIAAARLWAKPGADDRVWTQPLEPPMLRWLLRRTAGRAAPGEMAALRRHIRTHPDAYAAPGGRLIQARHGPGRPHSAQIRPAPRPAPAGPSSSLGGIGP